MESPNAEFRGTEGRFEKLETEQPLSEQYKSMRDLLKVYGLSVSEENSTHPQKELHSILETHVTQKALLHPPTPHPSNELLLRSAFAEQLLNSQWLEMCRTNKSYIDPGNSIASQSPPPPPSYASQMGSSSSFSNGSAEEGSILPEQTLRRFESGVDCGQIDCILQQLRDHYHCEDRYCVRTKEAAGVEGEDEDEQPGCRRYLKTFCKKEEIVRHCKWHKKRAETLKFGFLRFSCMDDCQLNGFAPECQFNGKQTHYHCIEPECDKVYISTSDVQMHANYHRKTRAIRMQGFLRVRNLEQCQEPGCPYADQQTTHFHCLRDGCQFTFKNKGEMEKHKVYHLKDEQLLSDGFKKFFKADKCRFTNCRYDGKLNHIHCIRPSCSYVFHSSGQLVSHKRKHEKSEQLKEMGVHQNYSLLSDCDTSSVSVDNTISSPLLDLSVGGAAKSGGSQQVFATNPQQTSVANGNPLPHLAAHSLPVVNPQAMSTNPSSSGGGGGYPNGNNKILQITSIDGLFNRKRGRPPKNRFVEVYNANHARTSYPPQNKIQGANLSSADSPQAIFASFKLDKSVTGGASKEALPLTTAEGNSGGSLRKKPKLTEQNPHRRHRAGEDDKPVVGLIKSTGIFFPNTVKDENLDAEDNQSNTSSDSGGVVGNRSRCSDDIADNNMNEGDEAEEHETPQSQENGYSNIALNPFGGVNQGHHPSRFSQTTNASFVPQMFPVNVAAMEHNNGLAGGAHGAPNFGMEWLKYAYQQPNPLMVFATTAALLAASMNAAPSQPQIEAPIAVPTMDPAVLEYAKNMFLYNNFQQMAEGASGNGHGLSVHGHASAEQHHQRRHRHETSDPSSVSARAGDSDGGGSGSGARSISGFAKDEAIPAGYLKFRFNEDCQFATCGYRNHQSHFHCLRDNCYYSFCDKTRFVQHTARHERLDKLMGSDFKQFRSNMNCGYDGCEHSQQQQQNRLLEEDAAAETATTSGGSAKLRNSSKSSHFHCQKCDYTCTDTNKVVAHRRQHNKTDFIRLSGFRKVASSEPCFSGGEGEAPTMNEGGGTVGATKCHYSGKQTHYHCLVCSTVVLNRSQLAVHRHKGQSK